MKINNLSKSRLFFSERAKANSTLPRPIFLCDAKIKADLNPVPIEIQEMRLEGLPVTIPLRKLSVEQVLPTRPILPTEAQEMLPRESIEDEHLTVPIPFECVTPVIRPSEPVVPKKDFGYCIQTVRLRSISYTGDDVGSNWKFHISTRVGDLDFSKQLNIYQTYPIKDMVVSGRDIVLNGQASVFISVTAIEEGSGLDDRGYNVMSLKIDCPSSSKISFYVSAVKGGIIETSARLQFEFEIILSPF